MKKIITLIIEFIKIIILPFIRKNWFKIICIIFLLQISIKINTANKNIDKVAYDCANASSYCEDAEDVCDNTQNYCSYAEDSCTKLQRAFR